MYEVKITDKASDIACLKNYAGLMMYRSIMNGKSPEEQTLKELHENIPVWSAESMRIGLQRLCDLADKQEVFYQIYDEQEAQDDPEKAYAGVWYFPAYEKTEKPFIILNAGGAYTSVCSMCEAFPVAARLNELGYQVFALNYRVENPPVLPKPLEDLAAAYRFIIRNKEKFEIQNEEYVVCGFSAGSSLTTLWGTKQHGYAAYQLPGPLALFPVYPPFSREYMDKETRSVFLETMYGKHVSEADMDAYELENIIDGDYPPCYIVHCKDDDTVPVENSIELKNLLDQKHVKAMLELGERGGHGFGDGRGSDVEGWIDRAIAFLNRL